MYCSGMPQYPEEVKIAARDLFLRKHTIAEIHKMLNLSKRTLYHWRDKDGWDNLLQHESTIHATKRRLVLLTGKEDKDKTDLAELNTLVNILERLQKLDERRFKTQQEAYEADPQEEDGKPTRTKGKKKPKKKIKNDVSHLTAEDFAEHLHGDYFVYQHELREAKRYRNRFILKSRQIGATWYFAQEAFEDACLTGDNQIFLSATRAQADVFRCYIIAIAEQKFGIELKGKDKLELHTAHGTATLYFLSNNSKSAQSYHGHVYIDECFWINKFSELYKVATGMATHKKWRRTIFSTPSCVSHEAYPLWAGELYNKRFKTKRVQFPTFEELQSGVECADKIWRKIITIQDAMAGGCGLFDLKQLKLEYSPEDFANLFACKFIDGSLGVFKLSALEQCYADSSDWHDYRADILRPFGNMPVWGGYDPSRSRDDASFVIVAPPLEPQGTFRVFARYKWIGQSLRWQAEQIKLLTQRYNFTYIGMDTTGPGLGVLEMVQAFYPQVTPIHYGLKTKTHLVLKTQDVINTNRIHWDASLTDIGGAFLTVKQTSTANGHITYSANRTAETGHADVAWAIMHALHNEPLATLPSGGSDFAMSA